MDNPHITRDYIVELEQKPKALRDALLLGKVGRVRRAGFPGVCGRSGALRATGCTRTSSIRSTFRGTGRGWSASTTDIRGLFSFGVWAVDEEGRVYRYKELYGCVPGEANVGVTCPRRAKSREQLAELDGAGSRGGHPRFSGVADPAIWDRSRGLSVEEQIRKVFNGVIFMKGDNTRLPGKMQLHERLKFDEEGRPMLYVFENCRDFQTDDSRRWSTTARRPEDIDTAGEDHIYDETRYFLMSRPIAPRPRKGFDE